MLKRSTFLLIILLFFAVSISSQETVSWNWQKFHGPKGDNKSLETGLLKKWPENGPELLWTVEGLGKGFGSMSVVDNVIYIAGSIDDKTYVFAIDSNGKVKWKKSNGKGWKARHMRWAKAYEGSRATPIVDYGLVYHLGETGDLTAYKPEKGKKVWSINIQKKFDGQIPKYGYAESLLIDGDNIICFPGGSKGYMVALDKKTGKTVWANTDINSGPSYNTPILVEEGGIRQLITMSETGVVGVNADTGALLWQEEFQNNRKLNIADPVYHDGYVCVSSGYGKGTIQVKLEYSGDKISSSRVWETEDMDNHHGGIIYLDGYIYGTGDRSRGWFCLDFKTGRTVLEDRDGGKGSFQFADGMFYYLTEKGIMNLVKPSPSKLDIVSSFKVPRGGSGMHWAHPVVCNGVLYIRHADKLFAYEVK